MRSVAPRQPQGKATASKSAIKTRNAARRRHSMTRSTYRTERTQATGVHPRVQPQVTIPGLGKGSDASITRRSRIKLRNPSCLIISGLPGTAESYKRSRPLLPWGERIPRRELIRSRLLYRTQRLFGERWRDNSQPRSREGTDW